MILLNMLAVLNNAVVWIMLILLPIFNCSNLLSNPLGTIPSTPTIIGIIDSRMFDSCFFFSSLARSKYLSLLPLFFSLGRLLEWQNVTEQVLSFLIFFLIISTKSVLLVDITWSVCISKSQGFHASHFLGRILVCVYTILYYCWNSAFCTVLSHRVMLSFVLHFCLFAAFAFYEINSFISSSV